MLRYICVYETRQVCALGQLVERPKDLVRNCTQFYLGTTNLMRLWVWVSRRRWRNCGTICDVVVEQEWQGKGGSADYGFTNGIYHP